MTNTETDKIVKSTLEECARVLSRRLENASGSPDCIAFERSDDPHCSEASIGKYLGQITLKFVVHGKKDVNVFLRDSDLLFVDVPKVGEQCVIGDSVANICQDENNRRTIETLLTQHGLSLSGMLQDSRQN